MNSYGTLQLLDASPAGDFVEPLTLAEVKKYLELPDRSPSEPEEDDMVEGMIAAAREEAETQQGRDLVEKQYDLHLDCFRSPEIELRPNLQTVDLFQYRDSDGDYTTMVEGTDYIVDTAKQPGVVMPPYGESWPSFTPWPSSAVTIRFTCGFAPDAKFWSDSGARIKIGMKMLISEWFNNRLPMSYDLSTGGSIVVDRIVSLLRTGGLLRVR